MSAEKVVNKAKRKMLNVFKGTALSMVRQITERTPVRSGRLRGGWNAAINNSASSAINSQNDKYLSSNISRAKKHINKLKLGDSLFFTNNVNYARYVEEGTDRMRAAHMVKSVVEDFEKLAKSNNRS